MKKFLIIVFISIICASKMYGYHIVGGDFTCKYLSPNTFEVTMKMFRDCAAANGAPFDPSINIAIYDKVTDVLQSSFVMTLGNIRSLQYAGSLCSPPPSVCVEEGSYTEVVNIPDNSHGYYLIWERCCRNSTVVNIAAPSSTGMGFYLEIADPALHNSSPVFLNDPLPYMCIDQPFSYNFGGWDQDGDSLSFSFDTPLAGGHTSTSDPNPYSASGNGAGNLIPSPAPYFSAAWAAGFGVNNIIDGNPTLTINPITGQMTAVPLSIGLYAMAVVITEWRNGVKIGLVRRELEFIVISCNGNTLPNVTASIPAATGGTYTVYATDSLCFSITATDPTDSLFLTYSGNVFAGGTLNGPVATTHDTSGFKNIQTDFCWHPTCAEASPNPYHVRFTIVDNGCPLPKTKYFDFDILVKHPPQVEGVNLLCTEFITTKILKLYWGDLSATSHYFSYYLIYRSAGGSAFNLIDTIYDQTQNFYVDSNAINNNTIDYCYYVEGINVCGDVGISSDTLCTLSQINTKLNHVAYATVAASNQISLAWKHFADGPFSTFYIYKKQDSPNEQFSLWQTLVHPNQDSIFDYDVNTSAYSYSYQMTNEDYCSNISPVSNIGKTILLQGTAAPFVNKVNWSAYEHWDAGVKQYDLYRRKDENTPYQLLTTTKDTFYIDKDLDITGGNFFYKIHALENVGSNADSWSNELELLQSPQVFIPNAFTPNDDGVNDTWKPTVVFVKDYSLLIYNRWGQKVFESTDENARWNGLLSNKECPQGSYFFKLNYTGYNNPDKVEKTGMVTLVR